MLLFPIDPPIDPPNDPPNAPPKRTKNGHVIFSAVVAVLWEA